MTECGADIRNLSPPSQLPLPSSAVSGMGGMSSVPCARERAELVRAWWVTASGSGVAICGDTGTKLDRPVPAGFETEPARDPGKSPRAGCLGHHHHTSKPDTRCPPCIPHPSHRSRVLPVEDFVLPHLQTHSFSRKRAALSGTDWTRLTLHAARSIPDLQPACAGLHPGKMGEGRKRYADAFPGLVPGPSGVSGAGSSWPRHGGRGKR